MAFRNSAPSSGASRPLNTSEPSCAHVQLNRSASCTRQATVPSTRRAADSARSSWPAVSSPASSSNSSSFAGALTRVNARTFAYESSPRPKAARINGKPPSARATRTRSRAVRLSRPQRHASQREQPPQARQPSRRSNSARSSSQRAIPADRCEDSVASSSSSSPRGRWLIADMS